MSLPAKKLILSTEEYLELEEKSEVRHEYVAGQAFAMVGGTLAHNRLVGNLHSLLALQLAGSKCWVYVTDVKARIEAANSFYYPDVIVTCEPYSGTKVYVEAPSIIIEVLSPSTEQIDRREKRTAYSLLPSLREYALLHQDDKKVELYARNLSSQWTANVFVPGENLILNAIPDQQLVLTLDEIYHGVLD